MSNYITKFINSLTQSHMPVTLTSLLSKTTRTGKRTSSQLVPPGLLNSRPRVKKNQANHYWVMELPASPMMVSDYQQTAKLKISC